MRPGWRSRGGLASRDAVSAALGQRGAQLGAALHEELAEPVLTLAVDDAPASRLSRAWNVTVQPDLRFAASRAMRDEFANGRVYYELDGRPIQVPLEAAASWFLSSGAV